MSVRKLGILLIGAVCLAVLGYAGALLYVTWPVSELSINMSGVFGDSFGVLTSLFSGLAFAGLIITIVMQRDELALQREELSLTRQELSEQKEELKVQNETMRIQRFENTFFNMLSLLDACRNDIFYKGFQSDPKEGRDAIKIIYRIFVDGYLHRRVMEKLEQKLVFNEDCRTADGIKAKYSEFYAKDYGEELGQYYRTLYNILKLVDRSTHIRDKKTYTNLLRAQLSRYELALLFYNCMSEFGEKLAPLVKRYAILKHLEETCLSIEHVDIWREWSA